MLQNSSYLLNSVPSPLEYQVTAQSQVLALLSEEFTFHKWSSKKDKTHHTVCKIQPS